MKPAEEPVEVKPKATMKATSLRSVLAFVFVIVLLAGGAVFYFGFQEVTTYAVKVNHKLIDAEASSDRIAGLQLLKSQITQDEGLIKKADSIFATADNYQSQAIKDVERYAKLSKVSIASTTFDDGQLDATGRSFTVTLESPTSYSSLIRFLKGIEGNIPKLQVRQLIIGHSDQNPSQVTVNNIQITIAVR